MPHRIENALLELARTLPFEVRDTGGGSHVFVNLKEPYENGTEHYHRAEHLRTRLMEVLCGDPAPNHSAALMRRRDPQHQVQVRRTAQGNGH